MGADRVEESRLLSILNIQKSLKKVSKDIEKSFSSIGKITVNVFSSVSKASKKSSKDIITNFSKLNLATTTSERAYYRLKLAGETLKKGFVTLANASKRVVRALQKIRDVAKSIKNGFSDLTGGLLKFGKGALKLAVVGFMLCPPVAPGFILPD